MQKYDHRSLEKKWQEKWEQEKPFKCSIEPLKPKYYVLDMFPYPSGAGLHVGHVVGYTGTDIIARYKRQKGFNVLHPMGWDSFGLPAEQYAIRTGTHPQVTTEKNVATYKKQLKALGYSYDWDREIATSSPSFYKWTQWIFTKLYDKGLAYEADLLVNYCPELGTVLANEEVENGFSKEGGFLVERRPLRQWVLKITAYADQLLQDLDLLDWPEGLKKLQSSWIGKSEGISIDFREEVSGEKIKVFTTCAGTLGGVTFLVLAPEHPLLNEIVSADHQMDVISYQKDTALKTDLMRAELNQEKTGVFTGAYAKNPLTGGLIPIWIGDYVLSSYGTGAVMGVPSHDDRDFDFAKRFNLPVRPVFDPDPSTAPESFSNFDEIRSRVLRGESCWPYGGLAFELEGAPIALKGLNYDQAREAIMDWLVQTKQGERVTNYKLRDWLFSRQRYWGEPFPVLHFEDGTRRLLGLDELPLMLPEISNYKPSGDGKSPLAREQNWVELLDPKTGRKALRETNTMPNWAGSCWYYLRFVDPHNSNEAWSKSAENYWLPVDLYVGGAEHAVLHLLYARFWHKVLYDLGLVHTREPFQKLLNQGLMVSRSYQTEAGAYVLPEQVEEREGSYFDKISGQELRSQIDKMSKSKLNGVTPDEVIEEYGADALRLYEMFMGPFDKERTWNTDAVSGCRRFLNRVWDLALSNRVVEEEVEESLRVGHILLEGVLKDVESFQFNTAIAKMMEGMNALSKMEKISKEVFQILIQCLFPFAPHITLELWEKLSFKGDINTLPYPPVKPHFLTSTSATYVVQINGKLRGRFELPKDLSEDEILQVAKNHPTIQKYLLEGNLKRMIFVPNKLLNLVIENPPS